MFSLVLPRFFGFVTAAEDRDEPSGRSVRSTRQSARQPESLAASASETEALSRQTTIAGRPAATVLGALGGVDIEEARQALSDIYRTYFETLWHFAYRWTRSQDRAQEFVHNVFLSLWTRRTTLTVRGEIIFYLRSAVRKQIYEEARHTAIITRMESAVERQTTDLPAIGRVIDPEVALEAADTERIVRRALATISPRDRDVLTMRWIDRMTLEEIASELGVSKTRIRIILARATARIAPALEDLREG